MKETETDIATPEQLLQTLEAQLAAQRSQHAKSGRNRAIILVAGILFIVVAASGALLVLDQMLMDMRPGDRPSTSASTQSNGK
ncbi:MAG: hypothetical protein WDN28_01815 [Chthoniobacter sp.]